MPKIVPKSSELIQAQLATFAAETIEDSKASRYIYQNVGSLALGEAKKITRNVVQQEHEWDAIKGETTLVPEGTVKTVANPQEYTDFLRLVKGSEYVSVHVRAELLAAYQRFEPAIASLKSELSDPTAQKNHPSFLGKGSNANVFSIENSGKKYAVRIPTGSDINATSIDSHVGGAVLGQGVSHLEQIIAASYEDGVTVAEMMPGKEIGELTVDEITNVTDDQLSDLVDTLITLHERGIEIDPKPSNIFYDVEQGYGIVDYSSSKDASKNSGDQRLSVIVGWLAMDLENAGRYGKPYISKKTTQDYEQDVEYTKANYEVLLRYRKIVEGKLSNVDQVEALKHIDDKLESIKDVATNPNWVIERLAEDQEYERVRKQQSTMPQSDIF